MGYFETHTIWKEISKEEYQKEEEKLEQSIKDKGYLEQCFYRIYFREYYRQQDIYNGGLMEQIKGTAKVIDTKYYKSQGIQTTYLCGSNEYEFLKNNGFCNGNISKKKHSR